MLRIRTMKFDQMPPYFSEEEKYDFMEIYERLVRRRYYYAIVLIPPAPGSGTVYVVCPEVYMGETDGLKEEIDEIKHRGCRFRIEMISEKALENTVGVIYER